jgi:hypothetical protein
MDQHRASKPASALHVSERKEIFTGILDDFGRYLAGIIKYPDMPPRDAIVCALVLEHHWLPAQARQVAD